MLDMLRRLLFEQSLLQTGAQAMMRGLALQLLATLARLFPMTPEKPTPDSLLVARVHTYIRDLEREFHRTESLEQVAARLGISRRRFTTIFREITGTSWLPYLRDLRLQHAKRLLRGSNRTVSSVAFECGFEDVSNFHRVFKRETGLSPDAWRHSFS